MGTCVNPWPHAHAEGVPCGTRNEALAARGVTKPANATWQNREHRHCDKPTKQTWASARAEGSLVRPCHAVMHGARQRLHAQPPAWSTARRCWEQLSAPGHTVTSLSTLHGYRGQDEPGRQEAPPRSIRATTESQAAWPS